jgi:hypothetical protein
LQAKNPECSRVADCDGECVSLQHPAATDDEGNKIYGCPDRFIPANVLEWWDLYNDYKEFGGAPSLDNRNAKFNQALNYYRVEFSDAQKCKSRQPRESLERIKSNV